MLKKTFLASYKLLCCGLFGLGFGYAVNSFFQAANAQTILGGFVLGYIFANHRNFRP